LIQNPILKVLSTFSRHNVKTLLMGGQACILYGAAEFSRDSDFVVLADEKNLELLRAALRELEAEVIAVPPFEVAYLEKGHAVHFRCRHPDVAGLRIDLMSVLRGVDPFEALWNRRQTIPLERGTELVPVLGLPDLVRAKKTQLSSVTLTSVLCHSAVRGTRNCYGNLSVRRAARRGWIHPFQFFALHAFAV